MIKFKLLVYNWKTRDHIYVNGPTTNSLSLFQENEPLKMSFLRIVRELPLVMKTAN